MVVIETDRLTIRTNLLVDNGRIASRKNGAADDILNLHPSKTEDGGFALYLKNTDVQIGHVGITEKRCVFELTVGVEEEYRQKGYMSEALPACIKWIFGNSDGVSEIYALRGNIVPEASRKLILKCGFTPATIEGKPNSEEWYVLKKKFSI